MSLSLSSSRCTLIFPRAYDSSRSDGLPFCQNIRINHRNKYRPYIAVDIRCFHCSVTRLGDHKGQINCLVFRHRFGILSICFWSTARTLVLVINCTTHTSCMASSTIEKVSFFNLSSLVVCWFHSARTGRLNLSYLRLSARRLSGSMLSKKWLSQQPFLS